MRNVKPEHDGSAVDALMDDEDVGGRRAKARRRARRDDDDDDDDDVDDDDVRMATGPAGAGVWSSEQAALEASTRWLEDARALMLARTASIAPKGGGKLTNVGARDAWRSEAVRRWGKGVPAADAVSDWEKWVTSRIGTPPPPSDLQLLQEYYAHDAWQLLVACVLMSRVRASSSGAGNEPFASSCLFFWIFLVPFPFRSSLRRRD